MSEPHVKGELASGRRLRIAVFNRIFSPSGGGAERYSIALVEQLAQDHEVHVFAQQINHQWPGVTYHKVSSPLTKPRWINQLWYATSTWWATRRGFDVVHSHENTWHGQVQTVHVLPVKYNLFHGRSGWRLAVRWLKVATSPRLLAYLGLEGVRFSRCANRCIVVTSNSLKNQMAATYPATGDALQIVTPGVSRVSGIASSAQQLAARQGLGLPLAGFGILFVGNDYRKKGLDALFQALIRLPDQAWLAVVGNAAHIPEFRAQAKAAGIAHRVFFLGAMNDVSEAYCAADCLAHPTLEDTFAMVVLEAMSHGLPVVVSSGQHCGIAELLNHETHALILSNPRDVTALGKALNRLLQEPELRQNLRDASLAFAGQHQWSNIARQQEKIYYAVAKASD